ncbi:isochorismatase [Xaviernesmea oryzae]|uniref:Isochorismatase n=1 Tax=Xaviernesmea oryzae TaxID=464029 RepID=A0A1Q9ARF6_9HYPH|nr:isochorismatase family protein [Xaviernesmea oryzae]OLP57968.1 isochorismatase [Xaviernesmea oryzae]SEL28614.1 Nicotinamidase-related amidase [Xaviernesmea oryzae]
MTRALLVIDIQNDYFTGGSLPLWQAEETEQRILSSLAKARKASDRILLVRHEAPVGSGLFAAGSPGAALRPAILEAVSDAPVIVKAVPDAFQDTLLHTHLDGIETLLVCGMMTQNCVVFTALSRAADPYEVQVVGDLCTAPSQIVHQIALRALGSKIPLVTADQAWG